MNAWDAYRQLGKPTCRVCQRYDEAAQANPPFSWGWCRRNPPKEVIQEDKITASRTRPWVPACEAFLVDFGKVREIMSLAIQLATDLAYERLSRKGARLLALPRGTPKDSPAAIRIRDARDYFRGLANHLEAIRERRR